MVYVKKKEVQYYHVGHKCIKYKQQRTINTRDETHNGEYESHIILNKFVL